MLFDNVRALIGNPNIYQVSREQFEQMESVAKGKKYSVGSIYGISSNYYPHIYIAQGMSHKQRVNTIIHESLHLLYPWREHWWICLASRILARGGHRGEQTPMNGHTEAELPGYAELLERIRRQSKRFNSK